MYTNGISLQYKDISGNTVDSTHPSPIPPTLKSDFPIDISTMNVDIAYNVLAGLSKLISTSSGGNNEIPDPPTLVRSSDGGQNEQTLLNLSSDTETQNEGEGANSILNKFRTRNPNKPIIGQININFLEKKFEPLLSLVKDKVDVLMISETKLDSTFPSAQFAMEGYCEPFRLDRNCHGGGIMIYVKDHIPCKRITSYSFPGNVESMVIEITLGSKKWLLVGGYNPKKESISYFLSHVSNSLDKILSSHENFLIMGDFNCQVFENEMKNFCEMYDLVNLIKGPTCYKNPKNPSSIDVMLTNRKSDFQNSVTIETGLSDWYKMTVTVLGRK